MYKRTLECPNGHILEHEFRDHELFADWEKNSRLTCGMCDMPAKALPPTTQVNHGVSRVGGEKGPPISPAQLRAALAELREHVETHYENAGADFIKEVRKGADGIYGDASPEDIRQLNKEGHPAFPLPPPKAQYN